MKRKIWGIVAMMAVLGMTTGCGSTVKLNEQQTTEAAEYISGLLLKYDKNYTDVLVYPETTAEPEATSTPVVEASAEVQETAGPSGEVGEGDGTGTGSEQQSASVTDTDLSTVVGIDGVKVTCKKVKACSEYVEEQNAGLAVYPASGKKLAVVTLALKNQTGKAKRVYMTERGLEYKLELADGNTYTADLSLASNDMNFLNTKIKAGKTKKAVLIFQVPKKAKLSGCTLKVSGDKGSATAQIKS